VFAYLAVAAVSDRRRRSEIDATIYVALYSAYAQETQIGARLPPLGEWSQGVRAFQERREIGHLEKIKSMASILTWVSANAGA
jgi:hypothetical protein